MHNLDTSGGSSYQHLHEEDSSSEEDIDSDDNFCEEVVVDQEEGESEMILVPQSEVNLLPILML